MKTPIKKSNQKQKIPMLLIGSAVLTAIGMISVLGSSVSAIVDPQPMIYTISPDYGPVAGNNSVHITGINFHELTSVLFGETQVTITAFTPETIDIIAPPHPMGEVDVEVDAHGMQVIKRLAYTYTISGNPPVDPPVDPPTPTQETESIEGSKHAVLLEMQTMRETLTNKQDIYKLDKAMKYLTESMTPAYWADENHLNCDKGKYVFIKEKNAVNALSEVNNHTCMLTDETNGKNLVAYVNDKTGGWSDYPRIKNDVLTACGECGQSQIPADKLQSWIQILTQADHDLAATALSESGINGIDSKQREYAQKFMDEGNAFFTKGKTNEAIMKYAESWDKAKYCKNDNNPPECKCECKCEEYHNDNDDDCKKDHNYGKYNDNVKEEDKSHKMTPDKDPVTPPIIKPVTPPVTPPDIRNPKKTVKMPFLPPLKYPGKK